MKRVEHCRPGTGSRYCVEMPAPGLAAHLTGPAEAMVGAGAPVDDLLDRLEQWLDRLLGALPRIVDKLGGATSFSISVGTNVSLTVVFGHSNTQDHSVREISE